MPSIIKVGKTTKEKLDKLVELKYRFPEPKSTIHNNYLRGYDNYGERLCFVVRGKELTYSNIDYCENRYGSSEFFTLDDFLESHTDIDTKYIVAKIKNSDIEYYEVLRLEDGCYVSFSEYKWKEKSWAESELEVMKNMEKNNV